MALDHVAYRPRRAEASVLHLVIRQHLDDFLRAAADRADGAALPEFVVREFRESLTCGVLAHGFARVHCRSCAFERLVPFSCKGRGFCPSCGRRRMIERAAHLVDEVLPSVPLRQWVLTLPYRLRYLLAWDHGPTPAVLAVHARALLEFYRRQAGTDGISGGHTGTLTVIQRFGSGLNLNVHFHTLVFAGVFRRTPAGGLTFHPAFPPRDGEVAQVLATIRRRVRRLLRRRGREPGDEEAGWAFQYTALDDCTRFRVLRLYWRWHHRSSLAFLTELRRAFPFPVSRLQCDHGQEFSLAFVLAVETADIRHRYIRLRRPQQNSKVERSHEIDQDEFWGAAALPGFRRDSAPAVRGPLQLRTLLTDPPGPHAGRKTRRRPTIAAGRLDLMPCHQKPPVSLDETKHPQRAGLTTGIVPS